MPLLHCTFQPQCRSHIPPCIFSATLAPHPASSIPLLHRTFHLRPAPGHHRLAAPHAPNPQPAGPMQVHTHETGNKAQSHTCKVTNCWPTECVTATCAMDQEAREGWSFLPVSSNAI
eukprot:1137260-Pelagomonas_calceolata.AAC.1